jgi:hypothetical protein
MCQLAINSNFEFNYIYTVAVALLCLTGNLFVNANYLYLLNFMYSSLFRDSCDHRIYGMENLPHKEEESHLNATIAVS